MSRTTLVALWPEEKAEILDEYPNALLAAPLVWNEISKRYLGVSNTQPIMKADDEFWAVYKIPEMPAHHRSVFLMSCDRATVKKENYLRAAQEIRKFLSDFPAAPAINNWNDIAQKLEENPDCPIIGLWMNSITGNPFIGEWNDDAEEYDPVPVSQLWDVHEEIERVMRDK